MSTIVHLADTHLTSSPREGAASLDEQVETILWIAARAQQERVGLITHGGDLFDRKSEPVERQAAIRVMTALAEVAPVCLVRGNHDADRDLLFLERLRTKHPIHVHEHPVALTVAGVEVGFLPWPRKANLVSALGSTSAIEVGRVTGDAMRAVLRGLAAIMAKATGPRVLLAHAELGAALSDAGQPMAGRCDVDLGESDLLDTGADAILLGHIHRHQVIRDRIVYAGSPRQNTFGEDNVKGFCLVEVERDRPPVITHVRAPGRELVTIEATANTDAGLLFLPPAGGPPAGSAVRLVYEVSEDERAAAASIAAQERDRLLAAGCHSVKIDARVTTTHRVRSETIRSARTNADRVEAWWLSRGERPARAAEILAKLSQLEAETQP